MKSYKLLLKSSVNKSYEYNSQDIPNSTIFMKLQNLEHKKLQIIIEIICQQVILV